VGAFYRDSDARLYGTVNARALEGATKFVAEQAVSPKALPEAEKVKRWRAIWFRDVRFQ
jgi:hypothetical protein